MQLLQVIDKLESTKTFRRKVRNTKKKHQENTALTLVEKFEKTKHINKHSRKLNERSAEGVGINGYTSDSNELTIYPEKKEKKKEEEEKYK